MKLSLIVLTVLTFVVIADSFTNKNSKITKQNFSNIDLNIYNQPLKKCGTNKMVNGSWDSTGKCSERDGGVHQICIKKISKNATNFSLNTGQSNWSDMRNNDNHCVCLGAWSLYNAKNKNRKKKILKCDAIPKIALSKNYVSKFSEGWNKWNGLEFNNQIVNGVNNIINDCYDPSDKKSIHLKNNYCKFAKQVNELKKSDLFKKMCVK